jgi:hypothetical protein
VSGWKFRCGDVEIPAALMGFNLLGLTNRWELLQPSWKFRSAKISEPRTYENGFEAVKKRLSTYSLDGRILVQGHSRCQALFLTNWSTLNSGVLPTC